jgi:hypothetical protein
MNNSISPALKAVPLRMDQGSTLEHPPAGFFSGGHLHEPYGNGNMESIECIPSSIRETENCTNISLVEPQSNRQSNFGSGGLGAEQSFAAKESQPRHKYVMKSSAGGCPPEMITSYSAN